MAQVMRMMALVPVCQPASSPCSISSHSFAGTSNNNSNAIGTAVAGN